MESISALFSVAESVCSAASCPIPPNTCMRFGSVRPGIQTAHAVLSVGVELEQRRPLGLCRDPIHVVPDCECVSMSPGPGAHSSDRRPFVAQEAAQVFEEQPLQGRRLRSRTIPEGHLQRLIVCECTIAARI